MSDKSRSKWPLGKLVEIEWIDSMTNGGWRSIESYKADPPLAICRTAGYLLERSKDHVTVMQNQSLRSGHVSDSMSIPMVAVKSIRVLKGGPK